MKKKIYSAPAMEILEAEAALLLAGSPQYGDTTEETSGNLAPEFDGDFDD
jgi:hypothetical protein